MIREPSERRVLVGAVALAAAWRVAFLVWTSASIDADEAVSGVLALRISRFEAFPVWFGGQEYMGALDAYVLAPFVAMLGPTKWALKLAALSLSLGQVATGVMLARRLSGRAGALLAGLLLACPPLFLTTWSLKLRGVVSIWLLGQVLWLISLEVDERGWTTRRGLAWGLVAGLGTWANLLVFPYVAAAGLFLLVRGSMRSARSWALVAAGFVVGAMPLLGWNVVHPLATFHALPSMGRGPPLESLGTLFGRHAPILLGLRPSWAAHVVSRWELPAALGLGVAALVLAWRWRRERPAGWSLSVFFALAYLGCALLTGFGRELEPRYASVLGLLLALVPGLALATVWEAHRAGRGVALAVVTVLLVGHGRSIALESRVAPNAPEHLHASGNPDPSALISLLDREGVMLLVGEYWSCLPIAYFTGERIGVMTWPWRLGYAERFRSGERRAWAFHDGGERAALPHLEADLQADGVAYRRVEGDGWALVIVEGAPPQPERWAGSSSEPRPGGALGPSTVPANVFDRNYFSRWSTFAPQRPGQWLAVDLGEAREVSRIRCLFGPGDAPRGLRAETSADGETWSTAWEGQPPERWTAPISARSARHVRLVQTGTSPNRWWSVLECDVR